MSAGLRVELIGIGREILDGRVTDTNAVEIARMLRSLGLVPRYAQRVDDDIERMVAAFRIAEARSDVVIATGGLGPTTDDITAEAFGIFLNEALALNTEALEQVKASLAARARTFSEPQSKQALLPPSCGVLKNSVGIAPGFCLERNNKRWFFLPGVSAEMRAIMNEEVLPRLPRNESYRSQSWATHFTTESELQALLNPVIETLPRGFELSFQARFPEVLMGLHAECPNAEREQIFADAAGSITKVLQPFCFSTARAPEQAKLLEEELIAALVARKENIVVAESCTGGLIAHRLTNVAGSSAAVWGGFVVYDNRAKEHLGVKAALIAEHGAVSREVATSLAEAARAAAGTRWALATTGIAGPDGGTATKPIGLCYVALAGEGHVTLVQEVRDRPGRTRADYKTYFAQRALALLWDSLRE